MELCHITMSYSDVPGKHEFKIFQHYGSFSSKSAAAGLWSDPVTAVIPASTDIDQGSPGGMPYPLQFIKGLISQKQPINHIYYCSL